MENSPLFDLLISGCTIISGIPADQPFSDASIGVNGDRIAYVGPASRKHRGKREISASSFVATPGFVNIHTHAILSHARGMTEDMGFAPAYTPGVPHAYDVTEDEAVALARLGALEALKFGSTLINDMYIHAGATLPAMAEIGGRISSAVWIHDVDFSGVHERRFEYDPAIGRRTLEGALRLYEERNGSFDGRVSVMLAPHAIDTCSRAFLSEVAKVRDEAGGYVMTHLAQSRLEVDQVKARDGMTPAEVVDDAGLLDHRLIGTHCVVMTDSDIARVGGARMVVAHAPKINMTGGYLPMTSRLRRAGARIGLGTDNMHADIVEVLRWALISGRLQEGVVNGFWRSDEVFQMATIGAAEAIGREDQLGTLEVGKKADIVLFDMDRAHLTPGFDPIATLVHAGQGRDVHTVVVDGRIVVEGGEATLVDEEHVKRDAKEAAWRLWTRVQGRPPGPLRHLPKTRH
jgi:5-methylthioadenosine/S-adenosylhomocysteine deaminase